jgi:hypothetical protein
LEEKRQNAIQNTNQEDQHQMEEKEPRGGETKLRFDVRLKESKNDN